MNALIKFATGPGNMRLEDAPEPTLRPGHVIVEVKACGICGTDLHIQAGEYPVNPPVIMGHEFSGVIAEAAPDVTEWQVGQRVVSLVYFSTCGVCELCRSGQWNLCPQRKSVGSGANGAFARYVLVPARNPRILPDNVDFIAGAVVEPLACCTHGLLEKATVCPGDVVVVLGPGAIGLLTAQIAVAQGAHVVLIGTAADADRMKLSRQLGTHDTLAVETDSPKALVDRLTRGVGADVVCECSGAGAAARLGFELVRRRGQFLQLGLFGKRVELDYDQSVYKEVDIRTSFASTSASWRHAIRLMEQGKVQTRPLVTDVLPLDEWAAGFERARNRQGVKIIFVPE
ncbi:MAG: zinc-binding dehydrogenase [Chloroflexi bacterium]|nr:zinc-binding dehydrogenase [Chloroflexota bacterium]